MNIYIITNQGIYLNLFYNLMSDWPLDSGSFFSWSYLLKEIGFEKKSDLF